MIELNFAIITEQGKSLSLQVSSVGVCSMGWRITDPGIWVKMDRQSQTALPVSMYTDCISN